MSQPSDTDPAEEDEALLGRYAAGDARAFAQLYRRHELSVWRYLLRNLGNRALAEELMQEAWFAVARDAGRMKPGARFRPWLFAIARNRMIDVLRARRAHLGLEVLEGGAAGAPQALASSDPGPLAAALASDEALALARALGQIPREQRDAFLLQVEGGLSVEEVAAITASSFEATKSRLRYARTKLRELLGEYA